MVVNARLAYTGNEKVRVTLRGKKDHTHAQGYIRVNGRTVSGYVYNGGSEQVFFPEGINDNLPYYAIEAKEKAAAAA